MQEDQIQLKEKENQLPQEQKQPQESNKITEQQGTKKQSEKENIQQKKSQQNSVTSLKKHTISSKDLPISKQGSINNSMLNKSKSIQSKQSPNNSKSFIDAESSQSPQIKPLTGSEILQKEREMIKENKKNHFIYSSRTNNPISPKTNLPSLQSNTLSQNISQIEKNLNEKIENLTNLSNKTANQIQKMQTLLNSLNHTVNSAQKNISSQKEKFQQYVEKNNVEIVRKKLTDLEFQFSNLEDLETYKSTVTSLKNKFIDISSNQNEFSETLQINANTLSQTQKRIDEIGQHVLTLRSQISSMNSTYSSLLSHPIDYSKYLQINTFNDFKGNIEATVIKSANEIEKINNTLQQINASLSSKVSSTDLNHLKDFILSKLDELGLACNRKFADQIETYKSIKMIEQNIKNLNKEITKRDKGDNWLLAKKPLNGHMCASCEAYLGNLKENTDKYIAWNKYPMRDPNENKYKSGSGFSKMLQMMNGTMDNTMVLKQSMSCSGKTFPKIKTEKREERCEEMGEPRGFGENSSNCCEEERELGNEVIKDGGTGPEFVGDISDNDPKM